MDRRGECPAKTTRPGGGGNAIRTNKYIAEYLTLSTPLAAANAWAIHHADVGIVHMLFLPRHRRLDAGAPGRVIVENGFLPRPRLQLAIAGKLQHHGGESVGLAHRVEAEN